MDSSNYIAFYNNCHENDRETQTLENIRETSEQDINFKVLQKRNIIK